MYNGDSTIMYIYYTIYRYAIGKLNSQATSQESMDTPSLTGIKDWKRRPPGPKCITLILAAYLTMGT